MDIRKRICALAGMLALSLVTSVALADTADTPDPSANSATIEDGASIKNRNQCPADTTFFKNAFPSLTNGPGPGSTPPALFTIDGETVSMTVSWAGNNSFGFVIEGGTAHRIGVTVDTNNFIYNYPVGGVSSDQNLNRYLDGRTGDDVNHLDLCLAVDSISPEVTITSPTNGNVVSGTVAVAAIVTDNVAVDSSSVTAGIDGTAVVAACQLVNTDQYACSLDASSLGSGIYTISVSATDSSGNTGTGSVSVFLDNSAPVVTIDPPADGAEVSGTVIVTATVIDNDAVDPGSVTASFYPVGDPSSTTDLGVGAPAGGDVYTWSWDTKPLLSGLYVIEVSAADVSGNAGTGSVTVEVLKLLTDCFGILGDEDFGGDPAPDGYANGCQTTPSVNVQAAPDTQVCNVPNPPPFCYIAGRQLQPDPRLNGSQAERDAIIAELTSKYGGCDACEPGYCGISGLPDPRMACVRDFAGECTDAWSPAIFVRLDVADVAEDKTIDLAIGQNVFGYKGCLAASEHTRGGLLRALYPTWPQDDPATAPDEATGLVWIKTHDPEGVIPAPLVGNCNTVSAQSGYQPIGQTLSVDTENGFPVLTVLTENCFNPPRNATRDNGYDVSNLIETDGSANVLAFRYQMAQKAFDGVFAALDCARPTLLSGKFSDVTSPVNQAKAQFDNGTLAAIQRAIADIDDAADAMKTQTTWDVTAENCAGDALARLYNLGWRLRELADLLSP